MFILVSIIAVCFIGIPIMMGELAIGRKGGQDPISSYKSIDKKSGWIGFIGIAVAFVILSYYSVIGGWVLKYLFTYISGGLSGASSEVFFTNFITQPYEPLLWHFLFMAICVVICMLGVQKGIEKAGKIMMPALFVIVVIVGIRAVTLPGASAGLEFLFKPNFEQIASPDLYIGALAQMFYSLSLGMGIIVTYGSYMKKEQNITKDAMVVSFMDIAMAILASVAIMPVVFSAGLEPTQGPGLIFVVLPIVFESMAFGIVFAILFFVLVLFAAVTSAMSLLETSSVYFIDKKKWSRKKAIIVFGIIIFLCGIPSSLSQGILSDFTIMELTLLDFLSFLTDQIVLPISAFCMCIFVARRWKMDNACDEITNGGKLSVKLLPLWRVLIQYVAPIAIAVVFIYGLVPFFS